MPQQPHAPVGSDHAASSTRRSRRRPKTAPARPAATLPGLTFDVVGVPGHIHGTALVCGERPPPSRSKVCVIRLRCGSNAVRRALDRHTASGCRRGPLRVGHTARQRRVGPVPGNVHPPIRTDRDLRAANGAGGDRAPWLAVDADRPGKRPAAVTGRDVEQIACRRRSGEVDEMDDAVAPGRNLGLNAAVRHALDVDGWRCSNRPRGIDTRFGPQAARRRARRDRPDGRIAHPTIICRPAVIQRTNEPAGPPGLNPRTANPRTREVSSTPI